MNGNFRAGASNTRYLTFYHSESIGVPFLIAEIVFENCPLPMKSSPSSWLLGQFLVNHFGGKNLFPFLEYITLPVQKHLTPSNFYDIIQPVGSLSSLHVYAKRTLIHEEVEGPNFEGLLSPELSDLSSWYDLSDLQDETARDRWEMASSVISVMDNKPVLFWEAELEASFGLFIFNSDFLVFLSSSSIKV